MDQRAHALVDAGSKLGPGLGTLLGGLLLEVRLAMVPGTGRAALAHSLASMDAAFGAVRKSNAAYPVRAVDTTGAGDCFSAGFLLAWVAEISA